MTTREEYLKAKEIVENYKPKRPSPLNTTTTNENYKKIIDFCEEIIDEVLENGRSKDHEYYTFETVFTIIYGPHFFDWWNEVYKGE